MEFVALEEAKQRGGMRLVTVGGVPSPWSEAAKGILRLKRIPFVGVRLVPGDAAVAAWTQRSNAPVAMYEDEPPRDGWAGILLLAERIAPEPPLIPADPAERAWLFGLAHEICGELGLGWCRRLDGIALSLESDGAVGFPRSVAEMLGARYGYRPGCGKQARARVVELLGLLAGRLHAQRGAGNPYYLGSGLTALDLYSATFLSILDPLPPEQCPMPDFLRRTFASRDPETEKALDPILLEHRDRIYREHLELPVTL